MLVMRAKCKKPTNLIQVQTNGRGKPPHVSLFKKVWAFIQNDQLVTQVAHTFFFFKSKISFQEPSNEQRNSKGKKAPKSPRIVTSKSPEGNHND